MLFTLKSKRRAVLSILLLITGLVSATLVYRTSAHNTKQNRGQGKRVPLTVLQSSEPVIKSDYAKKPLLAPSKDGQKLYSLDAMTGELIVYERNGKPTKKLADSFLNVEAFAVGPQGELYLAQRDSTVRIVGSDRRQLNAFHTVYPKSIAVLGNGNVVVASPFNGKNLHLYNGRGVLLVSFGDIRAFDANLAENEFLNEGRVVVGPDDQIYYVSTYAPQPYVLRFSSEGQLLGEFQIEGEAIDLQTGFTKEFLNRRGLCSGGVTIITSASVDPETGHLWLGMNSLSTQGTVYSTIKPEPKSASSLSWLIPTTNDKTSPT
jgi:outer membrane protein assembly factor BamB